MRSLDEIRAGELARGGEVLLDCAEEAVWWCERAVELSGYDYEISRSPENDYTDWRGYRHHMYRVHRAHGCAHEVTREPVNREA